MLPLIYLLWRHQWGTYIDSSDINLFSRPWSGDSFYPILIKLFYDRCLPRSLMEKLWTCGASEWSLISSSAATRLSMMRTMQIYSLRFSKVGRLWLWFCHSSLFPQENSSSTRHTGTISAKRQKTSFAHSCVSTSRTDLPASKFFTIHFHFHVFLITFTIYFVIISTLQKSKDMYVPASVSESHTFHFYLFATKITISIF